MFSPDDVFRRDEGNGEIAEGASEFAVTLKAVLDKVLEPTVRPGLVGGV